LIWIQNRLNWLWLSSSDHNWQVPRGGLGITMLESRLRIERTQWSIRCSIFVVVF
jgi:hypothetical protein